MAGSVAGVAVAALGRVVAIRAVATGPGPVAAAAAMELVTGVAGSAFSAACRSVLMQGRAGAVEPLIAGSGTGTVAALS